MSAIRDRMGTVTSNFPLVLVFRAGQGFGESGKAEILARPSVLALSNHQAVIQIVDVIQSPVVESSLGTTGELVVSAYFFEPLLLRIEARLMRYWNNHRN